MSYRPPPTNATTTDPTSGKTIPVQVGDWNMFSNDADDAKIIPLMRACDRNVEILDGAEANYTAAMIVYGSDGRHITLMKGIDPKTGLAYAITVGELLQQAGDGPMWNEGRQPPYQKLYLDGAAFSGPGGTGDPGAVEVNWGHD